MLGTTNNSQNYKESTNFSCIIKAVGSLYVMRKLRMSLASIKKGSKFIYLIVFIFINLVSLFNNIKLNIERIESKKKGNNIINIKI